MSLYDIDLVTIDGKPRKMEVYRGKTLLIVNVASQCGFTPQYAGLQSLYDKFKDRGCAGRLRRRSLSLDVRFME